MPETVSERLREALPGMAREDVHAVAAFAEFLTQRRHRPISEQAAEISDEERRRIVAALDSVTELSVEDGVPVSNRDHDLDLYGAQ